MIATDALSIDLAKLKGSSTLGSRSSTIELAASLGIPTSGEVRYTGVTKLLSKSITPVVAITAAVNAIIAPLIVLIFLYISDAVSVKTADDAKFIINPYQAVVLKVRNSINAAINAMISPDTGP